MVISKAKSVPVPAPVPAGASAVVPQAPAMPSMPDLNVMDDEDDGDDPQDENHLMTILQKLKTAKSTMDSSRHKKKTKQLVEQTSVRFANDTEELINKHNKRWSAKLGAIQQKTKRLRASTEDKLKSWTDGNLECEKRLNAHKVGVKNILQAMADLEKEFRATKDAKDAATTAEIMRIRQQVAEKLKQVQSLLIKTHTRSIKDDRFTKIIKSFVASF